MNEQDSINNRELMDKIKRYSQIGLVYRTTNFRKGEEVSFWGRVDKICKEAINNYALSGFRFWNAHHDFLHADELIYGDLSVPSVGECSLLVRNGEVHQSRPVIVCLDQPSFIATMGRVYPHKPVYIPQMNTMKTIFEQMKQAYKKPRA
jgi:hypothetical protein